MKKNVTRSLAIAVTLVFMIVMATACGSTGTRAGATSTAVTTATVEPAKPVDLVYWQMASDDAVGSDMEAVAARFKEEFSNVTAKIELVAAADLANKVQTAIMAKEQPDILRDFIGRMGTYMNNGLLAPMDIFTDDYKAKFFESALKQGIKDNKVYIFPESSDIYGAVINKTLFKEAGAENLLPQNEDRTWTREEFEKAMAAVSKNGVYGLGLWSKNEQSDINTRILIEGGMKASLYNEDFTKALYDSQRNIDGLKWIISLMDNKLVYPGAHSMVDDDVWALFAQKKVAVLFTTFWAKSWIEDQIKKGDVKAPFEIMLVQYPNATDDTPKTASPMTGYGIFNKGDNDKIKFAQEFLKFQIEQPEREKHQKIQGMFPALKEKADMYKGDAELSWAASHMAKFVYDPGYASKGFSEVRMAQFPEIQAAYAKVKTPEQAMKDFTAKANDILSKQK